MNSQSMPEPVDQFYELSVGHWRHALEILLEDYPVYAVVEQGKCREYARLEPGIIEKIVYNTPQPVSPLKIFLLPVKENVVQESDIKSPFIVLGTPACDLAAIDLLDKFYLDPDYPDPYYALRREQMILIGMDCHSINEYCHCSSYGVDPWPKQNADIVLCKLGETIYLQVFSEKGLLLVDKIRMKSQLQVSNNGNAEKLGQLRQEVRQKLDRHNKKLPNYQETTNVVKNAKEDTWKKYAHTCVACGACATLCPTCTCFLLIDRPGFEKVKQMDACQYPGFQRVAGGEDPHRKHYVRFSNRHYCKYVWRPEKFDALACTGCGRCIEGCIGKINKNHLFQELSK